MALGVRHALLLAMSACGEPPPPPVGVPVPDLRDVDASTLDAGRDAGDAQVALDAGAACAPAGPDAGVDSGCDADGDRHLAEDCGGDDCDDREPAVHPSLADPIGWNIETVRRSVGYPVDLAIDPDGALHAVFLRGWPQHVIHATGGWGQWRTQIVDCQQSAEPRIALDGSGAVHVLYVRVDEAAQRREIRHAWASGDGFEHEVVADAGDFLGNPAIAVGPGDVLHAVWVTSAGTEGALVHGVRDASGWVTEVIDETPQPFAPSIGISAEGAPHVVYGHQSLEWVTDIRHAELRRGVWAIQVVANVKQLLEAVPSLVVAPDGAVHVAYEGTYATTRSGRWVFEHGIFPDDFYASSIALAVGPDGTVLVAGKKPGGDFTSCLGIARRGAEGWTLDEIDPWCHFFDAGAALRFDDAGRAHLLYFSLGLVHAQEAGAGEGRDQNCDGVDG